jgi:O-methyltransferase
MLARRKRDDDLNKVRKELRKLRQTITEKENVLHDPGFVETSATVLGQRRTKLGADRLWVLWQAVRNVAPTGAAAAEVGTFRGGSAYFIAASFAAVLGHEVPVEAIDTFEGHPQPKLSEHDSALHHKPHAYTSGVSHDEVVEYLSPFAQTTVHKGEFSAVAPTLPEQQYGLVHVDVDLYESTLDCLRYFGPRLVAGGVIVLDDYDSPTCPGVRRAAEEFLAGAGSAFQSWHPHTKQLLLVKLR